MAALDFPASPTNGQQYSGTNGVLYVYDGAVWTAGAPAAGQPAGGDLQGSYPNPTIKPASLPWTPSGATLTPTDATKIVSIPGGTGTDQSALVFGTRTQKARLSALPGIDYAALSLNLVNNGTAWVEDDNTKAGWRVGINGGADSLTVVRHPLSNGTAAALLTLDNAGKLLVPGSSDTTDQSAIVFGTRTIKGRLISLATQDWIGFGYNRRYTGSAWVQDDPSKSSWGINFSGGGDTFNVNRIPAGGGAADLVTLDSAGVLNVGHPSTPIRIGITSSSDSAVCQIHANNAWGPQDATRASWSIWMNTSTTPAGFNIYYRAPNAAAGTVTSPLALDGAGNLTILGTTATKPGSTAWVNPSDDRLKKAVAPYTRGLDAILALDPISYVYNGKGGWAEDIPGLGFSAQAVQPVMPEMCSSRRGKLTEADPEETDILMMDTTALPLAIVNAIKELNTRLTALEAR